MTASNFWATQQRWLPLPWSSGKRRAAKAAESAIEVDVALLSAARPTAPGSAEEERSW